MTSIEIIGYIILSIITICSIIIFVKKVIIPIINDIKKYRKMNSNDKEKIKLLMIIYFSPFVLWMLDALNIFSKLFPSYANITREYDWLSFIGTYSGAIISAILLIFITEKDREENTKVIRESQRPYLDISYMKIKKEFFDAKEKNILYFNHEFSEHKKIERDEYLTLCIKNNGASVAIIDINKTEIVLEYIKYDKMQQQQIFLNEVITRLSIKSGEEIYIRFFNNDLYKNRKLNYESKILSSKIFYRDLFNKRYIDECSLDENLVVIRDNEEIDN